MWFPAWEVAVMGKKRRKKKMASRENKVKSSFLPKVCPRQTIKRPFLLQPLLRLLSMLLLLLLSLLLLLLLSLLLLWLPPFVALLYLTYFDFSVRKNEALSVRNENALDYCCRWHHWHPTMERFNPLCTLVMLLIPHFLARWFIFFRPLFRLFSFFSPGGIDLGSHGPESAALSTRPPPRSTWWFSMIAKTRRDSAARLKVWRQFLN